jgi:hypothetical protein
MTPIICSTLVERCDSGHMRDSSPMPVFRWRMRLRSEDMTPTVYSDYAHTSWLRSYPLILVTHHGSDQWVCRMSYHLNYERLRMAGLDDCIILQLRHLVRTRLGGTHDSFDVWNLNISQLRMFKSQAIYRATDEHLA